jgi:ectoine hydroxylase-related dioxygenase (phytanoyl-CoA dioxygenase family)
LATAAQTIPSLAGRIREVTDDEVAFYREHGWVRLDGLIDPLLAGEALAHAKLVTGLDYDEFPHDPDEQQRFKERAEAASRIMCRLRDAFLWDFLACRELGDAAARLTGNRPLRLWSDHIFIKLPEGSGASDATHVHQDFNAQSVDRIGSCQFWIVLGEITADMGSLQHYDRSHLAGPLGNVQSDEAFLAGYPELAERYPVTPARSYRPGDVVAHHPLSIHFAGPNRTNRVRWALTSYRIRADSLYCGIPCRWTDDIGLELWQPFDHPHFPIVAE